MVAMRRWIVLYLSALSVAAAADNLDDARAQLLAGHVDAAIQLLRGIVAKDPTGVEPSVLLAETLLIAEHFDEAGEVVEASLTKHPSDAVLERLLGDVQYREGRIFDAHKAYTAAIKNDGKNARAIYGVSRVFEASCLRKKAFEMLRVARAIDSRDPIIASAFDAIDLRSRAAVARMEALLERLKGAGDGKSDEKWARVLQLWIDEAKALDGKPECEPASAEQRYRIRLGRLMDGRRLTGASLRINDAKADLRLDTGASGITLGNRFAERAGVQRLGDTVIAGIGNGAAIKAWVGYAPSIHIGSLELKNCIVEVADKGSADDSGGLVGSDIFRRFLIKINWTGQSLELDPLPGPAWDGHTLVDRYEGPELTGYSQMLILHHYLLMPTLISETEKADQTPALFLLDTGSNTNMISTNLAPEITKVHGSEVQVRGVSGKVRQVYDADKVVLQFANFRQRIRDIISFDLTSSSRGAGTEISGIMGLPLMGIFESVTLDYRDGRVKFDYKP